MKKEKDNSLLQYLEKVIANLNTKEQLVIKKRFGLFGEKTTLASIGRELKLSRERIRQIEKMALNKISKKIINNRPEDIKKIVKVFESSGGIIKKDQVASKILSQKGKVEPKDERACQLLIVLIPQIIDITRHNEMHDNWMLATLPKERAIEIINDWIKYLREKKEPKNIKVLIEEHPKHKRHEIAFLNILPNVSRKMVETYEGKIGLVEWPEVCPKTVRDKIHYVLVIKHQPMHFTEIARAIAEQEFDPKKVVAATVHNELIFDDRFVLIGRGTYALRKWGYMEGTVKDIITQVLKKSKKAMKLNDIYREVKEQRRVRKNTILINLQTNNCFKKLSDGSYKI